MRGARVTPESGGAAARRPPLAPRGCCAGAEWAVLAQGSAGGRWPPSVFGLLGFVLGLLQLTSCGMRGISLAVVLYTSYIICQSQRLHSLYQSDYHHSAILSNAHVF